MKKETYFVVKQHPVTGKLAREGESIVFFMHLDEHEHLRWLDFTVPDEHKDDDKYIQADIERLRENDVLDGWGFPKPPPEKDWNDVTTVEHAAFYLQSMLDKGALK